MKSEEKAQRKRSQRGESEAKGKAKHNLASGHDVAGSHDLAGAMMWRNASARPLPPPCPNHSGGGEVRSPVIYGPGHGITAPHPPDRGGGACPRLSDAYKVKCFASL